MIMHSMFIEINSQSAAALFLLIPMNIEWIYVLLYFSIFDLKGLDLKLVWTNLIENPIALQMILAKENILLVYHDRIFVFFCKINH